MFRRTFLRRNSSAPQPSVLLYDAVIIGAGLSGLQAGATLTDHGVNNFLILEASDRIGGRIWTDNDGVELGAAFHGPGQNRMLTLIDKLGLKTVECTQSGTNIMEASDGKTYHWDAAHLLPNTSYLVRCDLNNALRKIEQLCSTINVKNPELTRNAAVLDTTKVPDLINTVCWTSVAKDFLHANFRVLITRDIEHVSVLTALWFVQCAGGMGALLNGETWKLKVGNSRLIEYLAEKIERHINAEQMRKQRAQRIREAKEQVSFEHAGENKKFLASAATSSSSSSRSGGDANDDDASFLKNILINAPVRGITSCCDNAMDINNNRIPSEPQEDIITVHVQRGFGGSSDDDAAADANNTSIDIKTKHVIFAVPPNQIRKVEFSPPLPAHRRVQLDSFHMGNCIKSFLFFSEPFWKKNSNKKKEFSGRALSNCPAGYRTSVADTYDLSDPSDTRQPAPNCLLSFFDAGDADRFVDNPSKNISLEQRTQACLEQYSRMFQVPQEQVSKLFVHHREKAWVDEPWVGGAFFASASPGVMAVHGRSWRDPYANKRIFFAGTEAANEWSGYMEGAAEAGERAARSVLVRLGKLPSVWFDNTELSSQTKVPEGRPGPIGSIVDPSLLNPDTVFGFLAGFGIVLNFTFWWSQFAK